MNLWTSLRVIPQVLGLIIRLPVWALDYTLSYRRAKRQFKRHLIELGVPSGEASELAELFPFKMGDIIEAARNNL